MDKNNGFGKRLSETIERAGMTPKSVAQEVGVPTITITSYIKGTHDGELEIVAKIANVLGVTPGYLLEGGDDMEQGSSYENVRSCIRQNADKWSDRRKRDLVDSIFGPVVDHELSFN